MCKGFLLARRIGQGPGLSRGRWFAQVKVAIGMKAEFNFSCVFCLEVVCFGVCVYFRRVGCIIYMELFWGGRLHVWWHFDSF